MILSRGKKAPRPPLLGLAERTAEVFQAFEAFIREPADNGAALVLQAAIRFEEALKALPAPGTSLAAERRLERTIIRGFEEAVLSARLAADETLRFGADAAPFAPMAEALAFADQDLASAMRKDKDWAQALVRARKYEGNFQVLHRRALEALLSHPNVVTLLKTKEILKRFSDAGLRLGQAAEALGELYSRNP